MHQFKLQTPLSVLFTAAWLVPLAGCAADARAAPAGFNGGAPAGPRAAGPDQKAIWAIRCDSLTGPDRVQRAEDRANALRAVRALKANQVQIVNVEEETIVYYGRYERKYNDAKRESEFKPDPLPDLELIRSLSMRIRGSEGERDIWPFIYATMEELPTARVQRPEWNLENARGYWSLHVAVFFNEEGITNRRFLAEEYCRELREQGQEAYYHHGPVRSSVYVGLFPKSAVQAVRQTDPLTGATTTVNRIVDKKLLKLQEQFPRSYQNARAANQITRDPLTGEVKERRPIGSFIVKVPYAERIDRGQAP